jgi:hypothetical protein
MNGYGSSIWPITAKLIAERSSKKWRRADARIVPHHENAVRL